MIVFDDFTTASRYVDFPFKVKSSAIKLLKPKHKEIDLRFVFEKMQAIKFSLGDHKRYYISEYQHLEIDVPSPKEQTAIAAVSLTWMPKSPRSKSGERKLEPSSRV